jgi:hypothetical protein
MDPDATPTPPAAEPMPSAPPSGPLASPPRSPRRRWVGYTGFIAAGVALTVAVATLAYSFGYTRGHATPTAAAPVATSKPLQVPQGATIISQCAVGRGTQYVLAQDIPHGPVFNVYQGKVIGLEFMVGKDDLGSNKNLLSLPLYGGMYDHLDVGLLSQGHAGYPVPHYHVDLYNISPAESAAITCK